MTPIFFSQNYGPGHVPTVYIYTVCLYVSMYVCMNAYECVYVGVSGCM